MAPTEDCKKSRFIEKQIKNYNLERSPSSNDILCNKRPSPEYLVRTGSMKNKVIQSSTLPPKAPAAVSSKEEQHKKNVKSNNYAFYNIQAGCFTWQGRAYYKNSYMMQRNEAKIRKSFLDNRNYNNDDIPPRRSSKQTFKENANCTNYVSTSDIEKNKISTGLKKFPTDTSSNCHKNSGHNHEKEKSKESKLPQLLNDDIKIQTAKVKKIEAKMGGRNLFNSGKYEQEKKIEKSVSSKNLYKHLSKEQQNSEQEEKTLSDEKQTIHQSDPKSSNQNNFDDMRLYENWSIAAAAGIPSLENICQKYDKPEECSISNADSNRDELLEKMKEKLKVLTDQQFKIDYKIVLNNVKGTEIENKFGYYASISEVEKFRLYIDEFDSVNCLIRGLAGRLATTEDSLDQLSYESEKFDNRWMMLRRKKEKLELQLSEALWIKNTIERRTIKIEASLLRHMGEAELNNFRDFLLEKEKLISASAELSDKIKLCKKQIIEIELGHSIFPH